MSDIECLVFLPQKQETYQSVVHVLVPTESGEMDIYPDHADCFATLTDADVRIAKSDKTTVTVHVAEGGCYFSKNKFVLFVATP